MTLLSLAVALTLAAPPASKDTPASNDTLKLLLKDAVAPAAGAPSEKKWRK